MLQIMLLEKLEEFLPQKNKTVTRDDQSFSSEKMKWLKRLKSREFHKNNQTLKEAQRKIASENIENWILFDEYHVSNVTKTYTELEWE